jgi:hypothetical protein
MSALGRNQTLASPDVFTNPLLCVGNAEETPHPRSCSNLAAASLLFHELYVARFGPNDAPLDVMDLIVQRDRIVAMSTDLDMMEFDQMIVAPIRVSA